MGKRVRPSAQSGFCAFGYRSPPATDVELKEFDLFSLPTLCRCFFCQLVLLAVGLLWEFLTNVKVQKSNPRKFQRPLTSSIF